MKTFQPIRLTVLLGVIFALSLFAFAADNDPNSPDANSDQQQAADAQQQYSDTQQSTDVQQSSDVQQQQGAARISFIHGDVSTQRGDDSGWGATSINAPMVTGDQISTGENARAEVQLDWANVMRLSGNSEAKIVDLTPKHIQLQVVGGLVDFSTFKGTDAETEIDTPNMTVRSMAPGNYRIQVNSNGETQVIVRHGEADVVTPKGSTHIKEGDLITIRGTDDPEYQTVAAPAMDDWDNWNKDRDRTIHNAQSVQHTNHYYTGAQDLDNYGHWSDVPTYGEVWIPDAGPDWVPYRDGSWVWEPYWGWTWVSYEPWGWAPYHYGRWFFYGGSWCWWPGPVYVGYRPLWAPAYVSFFGFGGHVGVGFGFGSVGWMPIGPFDAYHAWWGRGWGYHPVAVVSVINVHSGPGMIRPLGIAGRQTYISNVQGAMTNARVRAAVSTVPRGSFGGPVHNVRSVDANTFRSGVAIRGSLPLQHNSASMRPVGGNVSMTNHASFNGRGGVNAGVHGNWHNFSSANSSRPALDLSHNIGTRSTNTYSAGRGYSAGNSSFHNNTYGNTNTYNSSPRNTYNGSNSGRSWGPFRSHNNNSYGGSRNYGGSRSYSSGSRGGGWHGGGGGYHGSGGSHGASGGSHGGGGGHSGGHGR